MLILSNTLIYFQRIKSILFPVTVMLMTQFYLLVTPESNFLKKKKKKKMYNWLDEIKCWMSKNSLQLNENKVEVIKFGTSTCVFRRSSPTVAYFKSHV